MLPITSYPRLVTETYVFNHDWQVSITYEQFKSKWNNTNLYLVTRPGRMLVSKVPGPTACTLLLHGWEKLLHVRNKITMFHYNSERLKKCVKTLKHIICLAICNVFCYKLLIYWQTHALYIKLCRQSSFNYRIKHFYSKWLKHGKGEICNLTVPAKGGS